MLTSSCHRQKIFFKLPKMKMAQLKKTRHQTMDWATNLIHAAILVPPAAPPKLKNPYRKPGKVRATRGGHRFYRRGAVEVFDGTVSVTYPSQVAAAKAMGLKKGVVSSAVIHNRLLAGRIRVRDVAACDELKLSIILPEDSVAMEEEAEVEVDEEIPEPPAILRVTVRIDDDDSGFNTPDIFKVRAKPSMVSLFSRGGLDAPCPEYMLSTTPAPRRNTPFFQIDEGPVPAEWLEDQPRIAFMKKQPTMNIIDYFNEWQAAQQSA